MRKAGSANGGAHLLSCIQFKRLGLLILLSIGGNALQLYGQVVANFSATNTSGCVPLVVNFTNTSTGGPFTSYLWDFGNGSTATIANPGVIYSSPGTYTVSLMLSGPGGTDTRTVVGYITVYRAPDALINASATAGCIPTTIAFSDGSTAYPGPITNLIWDFGDGMTDLTSNPTHVYNAPGSYNVLLSVVDNNGCAGTVSTPTTITVLPPITANFSASPTSGCGAPLQVTFTDASTGPGPFTYIWDFGDGSPFGNVANPTHTYLANGVYSVTLKITNASGCISVLTLPDLVTVSPIDAGFTALPLQGCVGSAVSFQDTSIGFPTGWAWDFGDGGTSSAANPSHVYAAPGTYNVQLSVMRAPGCVDIELKNSYIQVLPSPTAAFSATGNTGCAAPLPVTFIQNSTGAVSYLWDFGDGNTSTLPAPTHIYGSPGNYTVTLVATAANGCTHTLTQTNLVQIVPPVPSFTFVGVQSGCLPRTILFTNTSTSLFDPIATYLWDFGDGFTSSVISPGHTYTVPGSWTISLTVTTVGGCTGVLVIPNFVTTGPNPIANFGPAPLSVCFGQPMTFTDLSTSATGWLWNFGDGTTSTLQNPSHVYLNTGCYSVTLVANNNGCTDTRTRNNYACVVGTQASFTYNPAIACDTPATVSFLNTSTGAGLSARWDFGDPASGPLNTATTSNASHVYRSFGTFTVKLVSTHNLSGCKDSTTQVVRISKPTAAFSLNFGGFCSPVTTFFTNGSTGTGPLTYQWSFGDLGTSTAVNPVHNYINAGTYNVRLIVTDPLGCRDTAFSIPSIPVHAAFANFTASTLGTCIGAAVTFTSTSTSDSPIISQTWTFGDGSPAASGPVASHAYAATGSYQVVLTVIDANGCSRSRVRTVTVTRPTVAFTRVDTLLCRAENFAFVNGSTGTGVLQHSWTYGDGSSSSATNAGHAYLLDGNYAVQLAVTDANGCRDSISHPVQVAAPVANFVVSQSISNCPPLIVSDTNTSTGNIASYTWDFGDGTALVNNVPTPGHIYNLPGSYTVTLIVRTPTGCADTLSVVAGAVVNAPTATFSFDKGVTCPGQPVQFIVNPAGTYVTLWDFGDGQLLAGDTVTHAYTASGSYPIQLLVDYTSGSSCATNAIGPLVDSIFVLAAPVAQIVWSDSLLCAADTVAFADSSAYNSSANSYTWQFGDGGVDSLQQHPSHFYSAPGSYTVSLSVTDSLGCGDADTIVAAVRLFDHFGGFTVSPQIVCRNDQVTFTDTSYSDTGILSWAWDFGDLATGTDSTAFHAYADTGWYDVQLVVTTLTGCTDTVILINAVYVGAPVGSFAFAPDTTCPLQPVQFTFVGNNSITPTWYFGNGDSIIGGTTIVYGYPATGTFLSYVVMKDSIGCRDTVTSTSPVTVLSGPMAAFVMDSTVLCDPDSVHFWDRSTYTSSSATIAWDFGDGTGAIGAVVTHYYALPGYYDVSMNVIDQWGCSDAILDSQAVLIHEEIANFGANITAGCLPTLVTFSDSSYCDTNLVAWNWLFGDGGVGTGMNVSHTYIDTGYYDVTLVVTSSAGCSDTILRASFIDIHSPAIPIIWAATVEGDNQVAVTLHADQSSLFDRYVLWGETGPGNDYFIATSSVRTDTVLRDNNSNGLLNPTCYRPMVIDACNDSTDLPSTTLHCTIDLTALPGNGQNILTWSPYLGWGNVLRYDIFEVTDYDTATVRLLASVAGNGSAWVDTALTCGQRRSYRVRGVGGSAQERAWSDTASARAIHLPPGYQPEMIVATVVSNADVAVSWDTALFAGVGNYQLFRSTDGSTWTSMGILPPGTLQYVDQAAAVATQSYFYRVAVADSCDFWSQPSGLARSILLQLDGSDGSVQLTWNPYNNWGAGVTRYDLEARPLDGGQWTVMATLQPNILDFHDTQGLPGVAGVCYRLRAYEAGGNQANSLSNEVCYTMDVWVPNTLTPNGDGFNDALIVRALAGYPGTGITIYNRWGNLVYETADYRNDWQGTNGNSGETLPDGVYYWVLHVSDGRTLKGFVNILR